MKRARSLRKNASSFVHLQKAWRRNLSLKSSLTKVQFNIKIIFVSPVLFTRRFKTTFLSPETFNGREDSVNRKECLRCFKKTLMLLHCLWHVAPTKAASHCCHGNHRAPKKDRRDFENYPTRIQSCLNFGQHRPIFVPFSIASKPASPSGRIILTIYAQILSDSYA